MLDFFSALFKPKSESNSSQEIFLSGAEKGEGQLKKNTLWALRMLTVARLPALVMIVIVNPIVPINSLLDDIILNQFFGVIG